MTNSIINNTFPKSEHLCGITTVKNIFAVGNAFNSYPVRCIYNTKESDSFEVKVLVSVGKKYNKRAVKRNKIRRRIKEAYRINKATLFSGITQPISIELVFIYVSKREETFKTIEYGIKKAIPHLLSKININSDNNTSTTD